MRRIRTFLTGGSVLVLPAVDNEEQARFHTQLCEIAEHLVADAARTPGVERFAA